MIKVSYEIDPDEMTDVTSIFLDLKPLTRFFILTVNIAIVFLLIVLGFKAWYAHFVFYEYGVIAMCFFWLFFRKKFNRWLFNFRLKRQNLLKQQVEMTFSSNGIIWGGPRLKEGHIQWENIKICHEIKKGYLLATSATRFLWLPFHGFDTPEKIENLKALLIQKGVKISQTNG